VCTFTSLGVGFEEVLMSAGRRVTVTPILVGDLLVAEDVRLPMYVHLIDHPEGRVLVDTGVTEQHPALADMEPRLVPLSEKDLDLASIDLVVNTHLHADHCGWNTRYVDGALAPTFPNAEYLVTQDEWQAAIAPDERTRATYLAENLSAIEDAGRLRLVDGETRVTDEVTIVPAPGHSAGHAAIVLASGGETAIYIGDLVQAAVQLERTAWVSSFDIMPLVSMRTKKALVERAIRENSLIIAVHAPFPGLGRMTQTDGGHRRWTAVAAV
jgi:N-acyl homoserine lactone hydrolase